MQISGLIQKIPLWVFIAIFFTVIILFLLIIFLNFLFKEEEELRREKHREPTSHEIILDLQHKLIQEMRSTSQQNWLMIILTIIFITISIVGGAVIVNFFKEIKDFIFGISPYIYKGVVQPFQEMFKFKVVR